MKKIIAFIICAMLFPFGVTAQTEIPTYNDYSRSEDEQEVKYLINDTFANPLNERNEETWISGWEDEPIGGSIAAGPYGNLLVEDISSELPTRLKREIEPVRFGTVKLELKVIFDKSLSGAYWSFNSANDPILKFKSEGDNLILENTGAVIATDYADKNMIFEAFINVDKHIITDFAVNGRIKANDILFLTNVSNVDNILIGTTKECVGKFTLDWLKMHRGYKVNEYFDHNSEDVPYDWELIEGSAGVERGMLISKGNNFKVKKVFEKENRKTSVEFYIESLEYGNGTSVAVFDSENPVFELFTTEKGFAYKTVDEKEFYQRVKNVLYNFRIELDYDKHTAELYMNNRLMESKISIDDDIDSVDTIVISSNGTPVSGVTGIVVMPVMEYSDYVPQPNIPEKDDIDIIAQMCPMWNEGYHFGYDFLKGSPDRIPLIGTYDESSSEAADWNIKLMTEHGVDVRETVWYGTGGQYPIKEYERQSQYKAMQNAKYADKMKWFIKWENSTGCGGKNQQEHLEYMLNTIAPFWTEYYFKDPNYYRIDGRPVVGFYYFYNLNNVFGPDIAEGIKLFRKRCEELGEGNPIILIDANEGQFEEINEYGFDLQSTYHRGGAHPDKLIADTFEERDTVVKNEYSFQPIPVISPGFSDYAWQRNTGNIWTADMVKKTAQKIKDEYYENSNNIFGKKLLRLSTWDEYAEGHYFAPSQGSGFGFMDAIYDVFVGDKPHTDILPTEKQKDRFDNRYPSWKEAKYYHEAPYRKNVPEDAVLIHKWDFEENLNGWRVIGGTSEIKDGSVLIKANCNAPIFEYAENVDMEITNVTHIKVRLKNNSVGNLMNIWYTTNLKPELDNKKILPSYIDAYTDEFVDIIIPAEKYHLDWRGILKTLQIRFVQINEGDEIAFDCIEFYGTPMQSEKVALEVNGYTQYVDGIEYNGTMMVPIRKLMWGTLFDGRVYYDEETDSVMYRSRSTNDVAIMPLSEGKFSVNGTEYASDGYYKYSNGVCYVSDKWISLALNRKVECENGKISVVYEDETLQERPVSEREIILDMNFKDGFGDFVPKGGAETEIKDGILKIVAAGGDPGMINEGIAKLNIDCGDVKKFGIKAKSSTNALFKVYFATERKPNLSEASAYQFYIRPDEEAKEIVFDLSDEENRDSKLTIFRFDTETKNSVLEIEYMRFYGDYSGELTLEEQAARADTMEKTEKGVKWDFEFNNFKDGWKFNRNVKNVKTVNSELCFDTAEYGADMFTVSDVNIEAEKISSVKIKMKNLTSSSEAKLRFITDTDMTYSDSKEFKITTIPYDENGTEYVIDTTGFAAWNGIIKGFRFVPSSEVGSVKIDYIVCE